MEEKSVNSSSYKAFSDCGSKPLKGILEVICGPMFSGKSTTLIKYINKYKTLNKKLKDWEGLVCQVM